MVTLLDKDARLDSISLESVSRFSRLNPTIQCIDKSLSSPLTSRAMRGPVLIHEDFSGSLQGVHIQDASPPNDADSGPKPSSTDACHA